MHRDPSLWFGAGESFKCLSFILNLEDNGLIHHWEGSWGKSPPAPSKGSLPLGSSFPQHPPPLYSGAAFPFPKLKKMCSLL